MRIAACVSRRVSSLAGRAPTGALLCSFPLIALTDVCSEGRVLLARLVVQKDRHEMPRKQYSVLQGLVRDLERALEESGTEEWKLLSKLSNYLFEIEEDVPDSSDDASSELEDESGDDELVHEAPERPHASRQQLQLPGTAGMGADVPRGTLQRNSEPVPLAGTRAATPVKDDRIILPTPQKVTRGTRS